MYKCIYKNDFFVQAQWQWYSWIAIHILFYFVPQWKMQQITSKYLDEQLHVLFFGECMDIHLQDIAIFINTKDTDHRM
jgi:hypothetical protein